MAKSLAQIQQQINYWQNELQRLSISRQAKPADITYARGRLISNLKQAYKLTKNDPAQQLQIKANLMMESGRHRAQLNSRMRENKKASKYSITSELALKVQKLASAKDELLYSDNKLLSSAILAKETASTTFTMLKYPVNIGLKGMALAAPYVGMVTSQIFQLPTYLLYKFINPDSPYNGKYVTQMGKDFGEMVGKMTLATDESIKRI